MGPRSFPRVRHIGYNLLFIFLQEVVSMNLKPLQDWAVIMRAEAEERTSGGIIIPEVAKEKPLEGVIIAIGPGRYKLEKGKEKEKEKQKKFVPTVLKPGQ